MTAEVCVPGMAMRDVATLERSCHGEVDGHRLKGSRFGFRLAQRFPCAIALDSRLHARRSPAVDGHGKEPAQLPHQVLDVGARAPVHLWRVLAGEDGDLTLQPARLRESGIGRLPAQGWRL